MKDVDASELPVDVDGGRGAARRRTARSMGLDNVVAAAAPRVQARGKRGRPQEKMTARGLKTSKALEDADAVEGYASVPSARKRSAKSVGQGTMANATAPPVVAGGRESGGQQAGQAATSSGCSGAATLTAIKFHL